MDLENQIQKKTKEAHLIVFGNLYLYDKSSEAPKQKHCYAVKPWSGIPEKAPFDTQLLIKCLRESPQVEHASFLNTEQIKWEGHLFDPHARWHFKPLLKIELNIPFKNQLFAQKMIKDYDVEVEESSKFTILYDGSCFMIVTRVNDFSKEHHSAPDVRDFLLQLLGTHFRIEEIPPNPMRKRYCLVFVSDPKLTSDVVESLRERSLRRTFYIPVPEEDLKEKDQILSSLFFSSLYFLDIFYAGSMISKSMHSRYVELVKNHSEVQRQTSKLLVTPSYHILRRRNIKKNLEKSIVKHYEVILDYVLCLNLIEEAKEAVIETSKESFFAKISQQLIKEDLDYYPVNFDLYEQCLGYIKEIVERTFSWKLALYGVVFGGISSFLISYGQQIIDALRHLFNSA